MENIQLRHTDINDGRKVYELIKASPPLDLNSQYYYHIMCHDFSDTCVIAEVGNEIAGFISGYIRPDAKNTLFIWQVAVNEKFRGNGLASKMLEWLIAASSCRDVKQLETTISPSNIPSRKLFTRFAKKQNAECTESVFLDERHFQETGHENEILYKISPIKK